MHTTNNHIALFDDWITWKDQGIGTLRWSPTYRTIQVSYLSKFLIEYQTVSATNLESCLRAIPFKSHSKRKHIQSAVSSFAEFLAQKGGLDIEERERIRRLYPKRDRYNKPVQKIISETELNALIQAAKQGVHRYQAKLNTALIRLLALTGLRVSEICNLKLNDIILLPLERAHLRVLLGKGGKDRIVPLTTEGISVIEEYLQIRPIVPYTQVFIGFNPLHGHRPLDRHAIARRFRRLSKVTGINFTSHSFRHFRITKWALDPRLTISMVQKLAGHSSLAVTEGYLHLQDSDVFDAFNQIA